MPTRYSFFDTELLDMMPWIHGERENSINSLTKIKCESDYTIPSLLKLLYPLTRTDLNYTKLHYKSGIRMKQSFSKYLKFCIQMKFIKKSTKIGQLQFYKITEKGHQLLDMFYIA